MPKKSEPEKPRTVTCQNPDCNHVFSFHGAGPCYVVGCKCKRWEGPKPVKKSKKAVATSKQK